jgi:hypothetical protein
MSYPIVREPRWPAFVAMLAAAGVYFALPEPLSLGPSWLLLVIIVLLLIPILVSDRLGHYKVTRILTFTANGIITIAMIASLILLVRGIPQHLETPKALLPERTLDHQYSGIRTLVLEARCRRSAEARPSGRPLK